MSPDRFPRALRPGWWAERLRRRRTRRRRQRFRPYEIERAFAGVGLRLRISDPVARRWYDTPEPGNARELEFVRDRMVEPGDVVFDCGCHQGLTTLLFSEWTGPEGAVVAFEALPENVEALRRNLELNDARNVEVVHAAVGASGGRASLEERPNAKVSAGGFGIDVPRVALDGFADRRPSLLKIDVEGYEAEVLKGAREVLATRPRVVLELHAPLLPGFGTSVDEVLDLLGIERYRTWIQTDAGRDPEPWDGAPIVSRAILFLT